MSLKDAFAAAMEVSKPHFEIWVDSLTDDDRRSLIEAAPLNGISHRAFYDVVKAQGARVSKETLTSWRKANGYVVS